MHYKMIGILLLINMIFATTVSSMTGDDFERKLTGLSINDRAKLSDLANKVEEEAREAAHYAVDIWVNSKPDMSEKAAYVLTRIRDLAIVPLLDTQVPKDPYKRTWRIKQMVKWQLEIQKEIVGVLERMLLDKAIIPYSYGPEPIEEVPPDERVCDAAYIQLRRLTHASENAYEHELNADLFLQMEFEERDRQIEKYRKSKIWTNLLDETGIVDKVDKHDYPVVPAR